jgi:hypothetical protein
MENSSPVDEKIRDLIHEYLMKRGMLKSVDSIIVMANLGRMG